jgi:hypothetical protein
MLQDAGFLCCGEVLVSSDWYEVDVTMALLVVLASIGSRTKIFKD